MTKYRLKKKVVSSLLTFLVIFSLLLTGPVNAISIDISGSLTEDTAGNIDIKVNLDETADVIPENANFTLIVDGTECNFTLNNSTITCNGATLTLQSADGYQQNPGQGTGAGFNGTSHTTFTSSIPGSGYGYGYQASQANKLDFNLAITPSTDEDIDIELRIDAGNNKYFSKSQTIAVSAKSTSSSSGGSSIYIENRNDEDDEVDDLEVEDLKQAQVLDSKSEVSTSWEEIKELLPDNFVPNEGEVISVEKTTELLKLKVNGQWKVYTKVTISVDTTKGPVEIIEVIPKEFANSAIQIESSHKFSIIEDDPIIKWTIEDGNEVSYWIEGSKIDVQSETFAVRLPNVETAQTEQDSVISESTTTAQYTTAVEIEPPYLITIFFLSIVALLVILFVVIPKLKD